MNAKPLHPYIHTADPSYTSLLHRKFTRSHHYLFDFPLYITLHGVHALALLLGFHLCYFPLSGTPSPNHRFTPRLTAAAPSSLLTPHDSTLATPPALRCSWTPRTCPTPSQWGGVSCTTPRLHRTPNPTHAVSNQGCLVDVRLQGTSDTSASR